MNRNTAKASRSISIFGHTQNELDFLCLFLSTQRYQVQQIQAQQSELLIKQTMWADESLIFQLLHHVPNENANLFNILADLVNKFSLQQIINLTENAAA